MLDERSAFGHSLASHGKGERDGRQKPFRHIGDNDADAENRADPEAQSHPDADRKEYSAHRQGEEPDDMRNPNDLFLKGTQS